MRGRIFDADLLRIVREIPNEGAARGLWCGRESPGAALGRQPWVRAWVVSGVLYSRSVKSLNDGQVNASHDS